jgi:hypothetical protein
MKLIHRSSTAAQRETSGSEISRRHLLQAAVGGSAGLVASGMFSSVPAFAVQRPGDYGPPVAPDWLNARAFQGTVEMIHGGDLTVNIGTASTPVMQAVSLTTQSRVWSAGGRGAAPKRGDTLLVRTVLPGKAQMAWVNQVSFDADVTAMAGSHLDVAMVHPGAAGREPLGVDASDATAWYNARSGAAGRPSQKVVSAHITGFRVGSFAVAASTIAYLTEADAHALEVTPPTPAKPKVLTVPLGPDVSYCVLSWSGNTSYFNCPTGDGACGTCNTGYDDQGAWAYVYGRQNCDNGCTTQCALKCGDPFLFYPCNANGVWLTVVDIGPCERSGAGCSCSIQVCGLVCSGDPCGIKGDTPRLMDLTAPTMARFWPGSGCGSCTIGVACTCGDCVCPY